MIKGIRSQSGIDARRRSAALDSVPSGSGTTCKFLLLENLGHVAIVASYFLKENSSIAIHRQVNLRLQRGIPQGPLQLCR